MSKASVFVTGIVFTLPQEGFSVVHFVLLPWQFPSSGCTAIGVKPLIHRLYRQLYNSGWPFQIYQSYKTSSL